MNLRLRLSRFGFALGVTFLLVAAATFALHVNAARAGAADADERALWFFLCTLPWAFLIPDDIRAAPWWHDAWHWVGWTLVAWNAFLLYCVGGGLAIVRRQRDQLARSRLSSR
jgi:drug/metabolite transporter (DMT)-like permease